MRLLSRLSTAFAFLLAASTGTALAAVIYVDAGATGANDGSSWGDAFTGLQAGLAAASASDELWVAAGTYRPTATADRTVSFALKNGVGIYGGFDGTETQRTQRDPALHVTTLSGDIGTPGVSVDNSFHVVTADATVTSTGVLDGFTISGGQADGAPVSNEDRGAGMWINIGSPFLANLIFTGNYASGQGGGMRVTSASPTLLHCSFISNSVAFGGAGGGLHAGGGSNVYARDCIFRSNSISGATTGGGGVESNGGITLINCVIAQNSPNGLQNTAGDGSAIVSSTFTANTGYGIAVVTGSSNTVKNSIVWGNTVGQICSAGGPCLGSVSVTYSDVQGGFPGTGNIDANPLFIAAPSDLRPDEDSPVVDAGNNAEVPGGIITDLAGLPRFFDDPDVPDTGAGIPPIVDMGAYERIPLTVTDPQGSSPPVCSGETLSLSVTAAGQAPLTYQWRHDSVDLADGGRISGATTASLTITSIIAGDSGSYDVVVTDDLGQTATSGAANITVNTTPTAAASGAATICVGSSTPLTGSGGASCSWSPTTGLSDAASCTPTATPASTTTYTLTVTSVDGCASTNGPTVTVEITDIPVTPTITAPLSVPVGASGATASVPSHAGATYDWTLTGGTITGGQTTNQIAYDAGTPGTTMHLTVVETINGCSSPTGATVIQVDFSDVPPTNQYHVFVITVARNGVTVGCGGGNYCATGDIKRSEMAVFLLKSLYGASHTPPGATGGIFGDVGVGDFAADWIEELANLGITTGCGNGNYCPNASVTRAEMAVFLLKTLNGAGYNPPLPTGIFFDVPLDSFADDWIEDLYGRGITSGCNVNPLRYCPNSQNKRQEMAVFVTRTFNLQ